MVKTYTTRDADEPIARREEFRTHGALRGERVNDTTTPFTGILPSEWVEVIRKDRPYYVVYSYSTPIAWFNGTHWTIPDTRYSLTTSRHQTVARVAVRMSGEYVIWQNSYGASTLPSGDVLADSASV